MAGLGRPLQVKNPKAIVACTIMAGGCLFTLPALALNEGSADLRKDIVLWQGLTTASTKADVKAFKAKLPNKKFELAPGCKAEVLHRHIKKKLVSIILLGIDKEAPCPQMLLDELTKQYGEPEVTRGTQATGPIFTGSSMISDSITRQDYTWRLPEKRVALYVMPGKIKSYNLVYTIRPDKYLH